MIKKWHSVESAAFRHLNGAITHFTFCLVFIFIGRFDALIGACSSDSPCVYQTRGCECGARDLCMIFVVREFKRKHRRAHAVHSFLSLDDL